MAGVGAEWLFGGLESVRVSASAVAVSNLPSGEYIAGAIAPRLAGVSQPELDAAFDHCRSVTRARARNFYYGLRLTPEPRRSAIYSIYAWMRAADDAADDAGSIEARRQALTDYRAHTEALLAGGEVPQGPLWTAFAATVRSFPLPPQIFRDMLDGLDEDLSGVAYANDDELARYCYRVAGTAGLACIWIWGLRPGADVQLAHDLALRRGQAFQRTNILRDLAQDFDISPPPARVYLPAECFARHAIAPSELRVWNPPERCEALIREQAAIAREHYRVSDPLIDLIDPACRSTLWAMTRIYSGILARIEADPSCIVGSRRVRVPGSVKASIAVRAAIRAKVGRW